MLLMDWMINNAYNNTKAEKSQLRETLCMARKQFMEEEWIFGRIFATIKWPISQ